METLMEEIALEGVFSWSRPVDTTDAQAILTAVIRQLSMRHDKGVPVGLRYAKTFVDLAFKAVVHFKLIDLYMSLYTAASNRLWYELVRTGQPDIGESWETILWFAVTLIEASVCVLPST